ncbi:MAG: T9SS type A sorting domain-containing protein [Ignavibacteriae bacterium]|nr:T9SS type A sorting domain-containing protein [Ignavibacteriota bacterium]
MMKILSIIFLTWLFFTNLQFAQDTIPPAIPNNFRAYSYEFHGDLYWDIDENSDVKNFIIYKWNGSVFTFLEMLPNNVNNKMIWLGELGKSEKYKIQAIDNSGKTSELSSEVEILTSEMSDEEFMDMVQRATFRYFWDWGDPVSGVARERWHPDENDKTNTIGGGGFGVMAILVGIERGFISREQGAERILKIADFMQNKMDKFHGAFPHWFNGTTGKVINFGVQNGGDIVETGFMVQGLLCARQYFEQTDSTEVQIRNLITQLWENVDWDFYRNSSTGLYWNWSPTLGFNFNDTFIFHGWNETLMPYLLALASPTHPIAQQYYASGWGNNGNIKYTGSPKYEITLSVGSGYGGPLFFTHYSFIGFDPRVKRDLYANYFGQNINQTMLNLNYCIDNPKNHTGYSEECWGLTASYSIPGIGYTAHEPNNDNGTIAPTAALSSMPYTPYASTQAMKYFYRNLKNKLWGKYGFKDAFNLTYSSNGVKGEWFSDGYLAIDQGPIICMIENYRSQLLWNLFMNDPDIKRLFKSYPPFFDSETPTDIEEQNEIPNKFSLEQNYPNPFNPTTTIKYNIPSNVKNKTLPTGRQESNVKIYLYDILGKEIATLVNENQNPGNYKIEFRAENLSSGIYYYTLITGNFIETKKMILLK